MRNLLLLSLLFGFCLFFSCKKKEEHQILCNEIGSIPNEDNTACICNPTLYYTLGYGTPSSRCIANGEFICKVKGAARCVVPGVLDTDFGTDSVGIFELIAHNVPAGSGLFFVANSGSDHRFGRNGEVTFNSDGSFDYTFDIVQIFCAESLDWASRTNSILAKGRGQGKSNAANTEVDITIYYEDYFGMPLDTGYLHLWKE